MREPIEKMMTMDEGTDMKVSKIYEKFKIQL